MTDIEEFLANQKRFRCERLHAVITEQQCNINKKSGRIISCGGCPGLSKEPVKMKKKCNEPDCLNINWKSGKCYRHHPENISKKNSVAVPVIRSTPTDSDKLAEVMKPVKTPPIPATETKISDAEIHIVNLIYVFKQKQEAELTAFSEHLSNITDPVEKLLFTLKAVQI